MIFRLLKWRVVLRPVFCLLFVASVFLSMGVGVAEAQTYQNGTVDLSNYGINQLGLQKSKTKFFTSTEFQEYTYI